MEGQPAGVDSADLAATGGVSRVHTELGGAALGTVTGPPHIPRTIAGPVEGLSVAGDIPLDRVPEQRRIPRLLIMHVSTSYGTQVGDQPRASWRSEAERLGMRGTQELTDVGEVAAADDIGGFLGVEPGSTVIVRRRVMLLDDEPVQLADSYYPLDLVRGTPIAERRKLPGGTVAALERLGLELGGFDEHVTARAATPEERQSLRLADGVPVLVLTRTTYTTDGQPVEVSRAILAADRHQLTYRLPARA